MHLDRWWWVGSTVQVGDETRVKSACEFHARCVESGLGQSVVVLQESEYNNIARRSVDKVGNVFVV